MSNLAALAARVKSELLRRIVSGELKPGSRVSVRTVSAELGVGVTPTRDALLALRHEGLIEVVPHHGNVVRQLTPAEVKARYALRLALERVAFRWAVGKITPTIHQALHRLCDEMERFVRENDQVGRLDANMKFHRLIFAAAQNGEISRAAESPVLHAAYPMGVGFSEEDLLAHIDEHRRMADLLVAGNLAEAEAVLEEHLTRPVPEAEAMSLEVLMAAKKEL